MQIWHLSPDTPRLPQRVSLGERVRLVIGSWPIESGQAVQVSYRIEHADGNQTEDQLDASWQYNDGINSYWTSDFGPFNRSDRVTYWVQGHSTEGQVLGPKMSFKVGPKLHLAVLWHQHQPMYKDTAHSSQTGSYLHPWVRLHAIRDY